MLIIAQDLARATITGHTIIDSYSHAKEREIPVHNPGIPDQVGISRVRVVTTLYDRNPPSLRFAGSSLPEKSMIDLICRRVTFLSFSFRTFSLSLGSYS